MLIYSVLTMEAIPPILNSANGHLESPELERMMVTPRETQLSHMLDIFRRTMERARRESMKGTWYLPAIPARPKAGASTAKICLNNISVHDVMTSQEVGFFCAGVTEVRDERGKLRMRRYARVASSHALAWPRKSLIAEIDVENGVMVSGYWNDGSGQPADEALDSGTGPRIASEPMRIAKTNPESSGQVQLLPIQDARFTESAPTTAKFEEDGKYATYLDEGGKIDENRTGSILQMHSHGVRRETGQTPRTWRGGKIKRATRNWPKRHNSANARNEQRKLAVPARSSSIGEDAGACNEIRE